MKALLVLALTATTLSAQAATPAASPATGGTQAIECFAVYKMAGDAPQNASHKADIAKFQNLMQWSMEKTGVTQQKFNGTVDTFMAKLRNMGPVDGQKYMDGKIASCNTYAKAQYDAFNKEKAAAPTK
ncbi:hypothetical protein [Solilutibacter silvestris]|uniref:Uncharacterized protein n=1 Tax=Solilutibacter silvestris TaxID=1645665 RepID=A0A2K1PYR0_9GAMM|nr:hypothetical protein [Lysobacter silvestris]PNS07935.1 hypothetical protein Lysil_2111 [Lysobacter silvestris]